MKKFLILFIALTMIAALAACQPAGKPEATAEPTEAAVATAEPTAEPTEAPTAEPTEEPTAEPTEEPTEVPDTTEALVAQYAELAKSQMDALAQSFAAYYEMTSYAEGRSFVLQYKYNEGLQGDAEQIKSSLDASAASNIAMYDELSAFAKDEDVSVIYRYLNSDGTPLLDYVIDKDYAANNR